MNKHEAREKGLLTRAEMIQSAGLSESAFDRLGLKPVARSGRHTFYTGRQVLVAEIVKRLRKDHPWMTEGAAMQQAEDFIGR